VSVSAVAQRGWTRSHLPEAIGIDDLRSAFEDAYAGEVGSIGHENVAQLDDARIAASPVLSALRVHVDGLMAAEAGDLAFGKLWLVESSAASTAHDTVPYLPHIDRDRYLKAMVYLDDVGAADGPLTMAELAPERMEAMRRALPDDYKAKGGNVVHDDLGYAPLTGVAGDLILFDTNCPHHAGRVEAGGRRRVLRFDYSRPGWNREPGPLARLRAALRRRLPG
jgi:hypothetical protein